MHSFQYKKWQIKYFLYINTQIFKYMYHKRTTITFFSNLKKKTPKTLKYMTNMLEEPPPPNTSERMNFNDIDQKHLIWKLFIYWYLMSFFHKKKMSQNVWTTIMPFGPVTLFYWPKKKDRLHCTKTKKIKQKQMNQV
jgi:hypothetical protein